MLQLKFVKEQSSYKSFPKLVPVKMNIAQNSLVVYDKSTDSFLVLKKNHSYNGMWVYEDKDSYNEFQVAVFKLIGEPSLTDTLMI